jgi:hypothetical protein
MENRMSIINKTEAIKYLLWILGDKNKQKEHARWWERILTLSPVGEIADGGLCNKIVSKLAKWAEDQIERLGHA